MHEARRYPEIVYTAGFARSASGWLDEPTVRALEDRLAANPRAGDVIPHTGGARKLRVALPG